MTPLRLRRRHFLTGSVAVVGTWALVKAGLGAKFVPPGDLPASRFLSPAQAATLTAAAFAIVGADGSAAARRGEWHPVTWTDGMLAHLAPGDRSTIALGLTLLDAWTWRVRGFAQADAAAQAQWLGCWRESRLAVRRAVWGFVHAAACSGFATTPTAWALMGGYPGPCRADVGFPGRPFGQTQAYTWDVRVP